MNTPEEDQENEWLGELYAEHAQQAVSEFKVDQLRSFYLQHPEVAQGSHRALREARALLPNHLTAAFIFAAVATETLLKGTLLRPIVYGLIHDEAAARLVIEIALARIGISTYAKLLIKILTDQAGVDLRSHQRPTASATLWKEIDAIRERRNDVLHRGEFVASHEARHAVDVAAYLQELVLPTILEKLGLHTHENLVICGRHHLPPELEALLQRSGPSRTER